jgi:hypothetical protein
MERAGNHAHLATLVEKNINDSQSGAGTFCRMHLKHFKHIFVSVQHLI